MQNQNGQEKKLGAKRLFFSKTLLAKSHSRKITYIAVATALMTVVNALEIKLGGIQFSLTVFTAALTGLLLGGAAGFSACFLGDMLGFFIHPFGEYSPWIGISTGLMAFFIAVFLLLPNAKTLLRIYLGLGYICIFVFCTCGITTLYLNLVWYKGMTFWECLFMRLFVQGQIFNSFFNFVLLIIAAPAITKIKALRIQID
jgi:biotin transporter BioY